MTTIAYRDAVMAADSRAYSGSTCPIGNKVKCAHLADGTLVGVSTTQPGSSERLVKWLSQLAVKGRLADVDWEDAPRLDELGKFTVLAVLDDRRALVFEDSLFPAVVTAAYYAIGSGREYALGAMATGASALQALRVATELDVWSALPITTVKHTGHTFEYTL